MIPLTVVVVTRNRWNVCRRALWSICGRQLENGAYDVILVDNGSSDGTAVNARQEFGAMLQVVEEPVAGASRGRNAGLRAATGRYVAFLDDDAIAPHDWAGIAGALADHGEIDAFGGPILPMFEVEPPRWFREEYETRSWGGAARELEPGEVFSGSNMGWKRETLVEIGGFDESLGPAGGQFACGEDTELFIRLWRLKPGAFVWYDPALAVEHSVTEAKMRPRFALRRGYLEGRGWIVANSPIGRGNAVRQLMRRLLILVALSVFSIVWPRWIWSPGRWCCETGKKLTCQWGNVVGLIGEVRGRGGKQAERSAA